jgi:hypothetical protein
VPRQYSTSIQTIHSTYPTNDNAFFQEETIISVGIQPSLATSLETSIDFVDGRSVDSFLNESLHALDG